MNPDHIQFYQQKRITDYGNYRLVTFENTVVPTIPKYYIGVYRGSKKIGEGEADNEQEAIRKLKARLDQSEARGGRLEYIKL